MKSKKQLVWEFVFAVTTAVVAGLILNAITQGNGESVPPTGAVISDSEAHNNTGDLQSSNVNQGNSVEVNFQNVTITNSTVVVSPANSANMQTLKQEEKNNLANTAVKVEKYNSGIIQLNDSSPAIKPHRAWVLSAKDPYRRSETNETTARITSNVDLIGLTQTGHGNPKVFEGIKGATATATVNNINYTLDVIDVNETEAYVLVQIQEL